MAPATLNEVLQKFYLEVRKQNGSEYKPDSLKVIQAALERPLSAHKYPYSLINSREFASSMAVLDAKAKELQMQEYGKKQNRAQPYNTAVEESFWSSGLLGDHNGVALTKANFKNLIFEAAKTSVTLGCKTLRLYGSSLREEKRQNAYVSMRIQTRPVLVASLLRADVSKGRESPDRTKKSSSILFIFQNESFSTVILEKLNIN